MKALLIVFDEPLHEDDQQAVEVLKESYGVRVLGEVEYDPGVTGDPVIYFP